MKIKTLVSVTLAGAITVVLAGCSDSSKPAPDASTNTIATATSNTVDAVTNAAVSGMNAVSNAAVNVTK